MISNVRKHPRKFAWNITEYIPLIQSHLNVKFNCKRVSMSQTCCYKLFVLCYVQYQYTNMLESFYVEYQLFLLLQSHDKSEKWTFRKLLSISFLLRNTSFLINNRQHALLSIKYVQYICQQKYLKRGVKAS